MRIHRFICLIYCFILFNNNGHGQYTIDNSISFNPTYASGTYLYLNDGEVSSALPIGFSFNFFGNNYTQFYMSESGFLTFDSGGLNCCEQYIPDGASPNNLIAAGWFDFYGSDIEYYTLGSAPNRTLHVNINAYNSCDGYFFDSQIILYESSNNIEIHTAEAEFTDPDFYGCNFYATQGIENSDGTLAFANAYTNYTPYSQYYEAVRYIAEPVIENDLAVILDLEYYCDGNNDININVSNVGVNTALNYYIDYEFDGVPKDSIIITDSLESGLSELITLESFAFTSGESYLLKVWTYNPNDSLDNNTLNDTIEILLRTQLEGNISIGSSGDYISISDASEAIDSFGICNDIVLDILPGIYNERLSLNEIVGALEFDITVQSSTLDSADVIISNDFAIDNSPILQIENNGNIFLKHLTLKATGNTCGTIIQSMNNKSLNLEGVFIEGFDLTNSNSICDALYSKETAKVIVEKCNFKNYSTSIQMDDRYSVTNPIKLKIDRCSFNQFKGTGIETDGVDSLIVIQSQLTSDKISARSTSIARNGSLVSFEQVQMYLEDGRGINVWNSYSPNKTLIKNCLISLNGNSSFKYGISVTNGGIVDILHNNIQITGNSSSSIGLLTNSVSGIVQNNAIGIYSSGRCVNINNSAITLDHNLYYTIGDVGVYNGSFIAANLKEWVAFTEFDSNSVFGSPDFYSFNNLHVNQTLVNGRANPSVPPTILDIDGDNRSLTAPDIGADEILSVLNDIALIDLIFPDTILTDDFALECIVTNNADVPVTNYEIIQVVNSGDPDTTVISQSLPPQAKDTILLPLITPNLGQPISIEVYSQSPNNVIDPYPANDTLSTENFYAKMNGVYTIGGASPDFISLEVATEALSNSGVLDSIMFKIRPGTYLVSASLLGHESFSCDKPIVLTSESGNASDVILNNINQTGPVLSFVNILGLEIRNLTIQGQDITHSVGVSISGESGCIEIHDCVFDGVITQNATTGDNNIKVNFNVDSCKIYNNTINGSDYGIRIDGGSSKPVAICNNNQIVSRSRTIDIQDCNNGNIENNILQLEGNVTTNYGIYLYNCYEGFIIDRNEIYKFQNDGGYGIYTTYCSGLSTSRFKISNNFVNSKFATGISIGPSSSYVDIFHNTVRLESSLASIYGLAFFNISNNRIKNNIISVLGNNAYALQYFYGALNTYEMDYNNLFNGTSTNIVLIGTSTNYDFLGWQLEGKDVNSSDLDPLFVSAADYHVQGAHLNNMGTSLPEVLTDIEGVVRNALTPDVGCVELTVANNDVGLLSINYPAMPFLSGNNYTYIKFINNGVDTLESMEVNWEINGVPQPSYTWTGLLESAATYDSLDIGQFNFERFTSYDIKVWLSHPNGIADELAINDTIEVLGLIPALAGEYTIGGTDPDFETLHEAALALNSSGIVDNVTFFVRPGIYADTVVIQDFLGASCEFSVRFTSENEDANSVVISNLGYDNFPFYIINADGISIDHLTIKNYSSTHPNVINASGSTNCLNISDCKIENFVSNYSVISNGIFRSSSTSDTLITVKNNEILNGFRGISLVNSFSNGLATNNIQIEGNHIVDIIKEAIYTQRTSNLEIFENQLKSTSNEFSTNAFISYNINGLSIHNNKIDCQSNSRALYLSYCPNTIYDKANIYNNFIAVSGDNISNSLYLSYSSHLDVYNNSIYHNSPSNYFSNSPIALNIIDNGRLYNNIVVTEYPAINSYVLLSLTNTEIDNNCYFPIHSDFAYNFNTSNYLTFSNWQSQFNSDANSISINPDFTAAPNDLHARAIQLFNSGTNILFPELDIDGELRDTLPDIGADEFTPAPNDDAGLVSLIGPEAPFTSGNQSVLVAIKNNGGNTLLSAQVFWTINGQLQPAFNYTGNLTTGSCDTIDLGTFDFSELGAYQFTFWTEQPNGVLDSFPSNDTLGPINLYHGLQGNYSLGGSFPDFFNIGDFEDQVQFGGIIGTTNLSIRSDQYATNLHWESFPRNDESILTITGDENDSTLVSIVPFSNSLPLIRLDNVHHIKFENLTFNHQFQKAIILSDSTNNVLFQSSKFIGKPSYSHSIFEFEAEGIQQITIADSYFKNGYEVINLQGSPTETESGNSIVGNTFMNFSGSAIKATNQDEIEIKNNRFVITEDLYPSYAIKLSYGKNGYDISGNRFSLDYGANGISIVGSIIGTGKNGIISNNHILQKGNKTNAGIYINSCSDFLILHNTLVNINKLGNPIQLYYTTSGEIKNNNIVSFTPQKLINSYFQYTTFTSDNNNLFSRGPIAFLNNTGQTYNTLIDWQNGTGKDLNSISYDPIFTDIKSPLIENLFFNNVGTPSIISTDINGNSRSSSMPDIGATEFDVPNIDLRLLSILSPNDGCNLSNSEELAFVVINQGVDTISSSLVSYSINGSQFISETLSGLNILSGIKDTLQSTLLIDLSAYSSSEFVGAIQVSEDFRTSNDTMSIEISNNYNITQSPSLIYPLSTDPPTENTFATIWSAVPLASGYNLHYWIDSSNERDTIKSIPVNTVLLTNLIYDTSYNYFVEAYDDCGNSTISDTSSFFVQALPDLQVSNLTIPLSGFNNSSIAVNWVVNNITTGNTGMKTWHDVIYLSEDATFNPSLDIILGTVNNTTALNGIDSYISNKDVTLPPLNIGEYYILVVSDRYGALKEENENNNVGYSSQKILIEVSPHVDLIPSSIGVPAIQFNNDTLYYSWTVKNMGDAPTNISNEWRDYLYLSRDSLSLNIEMYLTTDLISKVILPDSSITLMGKKYIPSSVIGDFWIYLEVDKFNQIFEFVNENNNSRVSERIQILNPPLPDMVNLINTLPDTLDPYEIIDPFFIFKNIGLSDVNGYFENSLYQGISPIYNTNYLTLMQKNGYSQILKSDSIGSTQYYTRIPQNISGNRYFYHALDKGLYNNIIEVNENNNVIQKVVYIQEVDAKLVEFDFTSSIMANSSKPFTVKIINNGPGDFHGQPFKLAAYISDLATFNPLQSTSIYSKNFNINLAEGDTMMLNGNLLVPYNQVGSKYIHIVFDSENNIIENNELNNIVSSPLQVFDSGTKDLTAVLTNIPSTVYEGKTYIFNYEVINLGAIPHEGSTAINIYMSSESTWNLNNATLLASHNIPSGINESGTEALTFVTIPEFTPPNNVYFYFWVDPNNIINELNGEANNIVRSDAVSLLTQAVVDVEIGSVSINNLTPNSNTVINCQVELSRDLTEMRSNTIDIDYLLISEQVGGQDFVLKSESVNWPVGTTTLSVSQDLNIPAFAIGNYVLKVVADISGKLAETNTLNNIYELSPALIINQGQSPDLKFLNVFAPSSAITGELINLTFETENLGTSVANNYKVSAYLSSDYILDNQDFVLSYSTISNHLINTVRYDTIQTAIPSSYSGSYVIIFKVDSQNNIDEINGEDNNLSFVPILVTIPPPGDLVVSNVSSADTLILGDVYNVSYTITNIGDEPINGANSDQLYLSKDNVLDISDILLCDAIYGINLAPNQSLDLIRNCTMKGLLPGEFYILVETNTKNLLNETNIINNFSHSDPPLFFQINEIEVDESDVAVRENNQSVYYKLHVDDSYSGETIQVDVSSPNKTGFVKSYMSFDAMPTEFIHDYIGNKPFKHEQSFYINSAQPGDYYILCSGNWINTSDSLMVNATLQPLKFDIVQPDFGLKGTTITTRVEGAGLTNMDYFRLRNDSLIVNHHAMSFEEVSPNLTYVTFNLDSIPVEIYDYDGVKNTYDLAYKPQYFNVIEAEKDNSISYHITGPPSTFTGNRLVTLLISWENTGNVDVINPILMVSSPGGSVIANSIYDLENNLGVNQLLVYPKELNGPANGAVRPGAKGTIQVVAYAGQTPLFTLQRVDE